jgi:hypothetical protein
MISSDTPLLAARQALEIELLEPAGRSDAARLDAPLHENFLEFGRSGALYVKADILARLPAVARHVVLAVDRFEVRPPGAAVALLTYGSADRQPDGTLDRFSLRTPVWQRTARGWQMSFHQGTPTAPL